MYSGFNEKMNMNYKTVFVGVIFVLATSSILQADEGERLKNLLPSAYLSQNVKGVEDLNLIKDPKLRSDLEAFCATCTEETKSVQMGVGGELAQKSCSHSHCPTLCPAAKVPDICKSS